MSEQSYYSIRESTPLPGCRWRMQRSAFNFNGGATAGTNDLAADLSGAWFG